MTSAPWAPASMVTAERQRRALVTMIDGHLAVVLPQSLTRDVDTSALIALVAIAIDKALAELEQQK